MKLPVEVFIPVFEDQQPLSLPEIVERIALFLRQTEPTRARTEGTRAKYLRNYARRLQLGVLYTPCVGELHQKISRNSFMFNRAALQFGLREQLLEFVEQAQVDSFGVGSEQLFEDGQHWLQAIANAAVVAPPGVRVDELHSKSRFKFGDPSSSKLTVAFTAKSSKRNGLASLGPRWREVFWENVDQDSKYATQMATLDLTGARPNDQVLGGRIKRVDRSTIEVTVFSSKRTSTTGIPFRTFRFDLSQDLELRDAHLTRQAASNQRAIRWVRPPVLLLADLAPESGDVQSWTGSAKGLAAAVNIVGKRTFPRHEYRVSPTSFRHELATDLKSSGMDRVEAAAAMSHRSTSTLDNYGRTVSGSRGRRVLPKIVSDTSMIRNTTNRAPQWSSVRERSAANHSGPAKARSRKPGA